VKTDIQAQADVKPTKIKLKLVGHSKNTLCIRKELKNFEMRLIDVLTSEKNRSKTQFKT
jgi:hypothetical protein